MDGSSAGRESEHLAASTWPAAEEDALPAPAPRVKPGFYENLLQTRNLKPQSILQLESNVFFYYIQCSWNLADTYVKVSTYLQKSSKDDS